MSRPSEDPLTFRTLHDGPVVGVREYHCRAGRGGPAAEEHSDADHVVLLRRGAFCKHFGRRSVTADVNQAAFFSRASTYRVSHPADCGDRGVIFAPSPSVLRDVIREFDPAIDDRPERAFPFVVGPCDPRLYWRLHEIVRRLEGVGSAIRSGPTGPRCGSSPTCWGRRSRGTTCRAGAAETGRTRPTRIAPKRPKATSPVEWASASRSTLSPAPFMRRRFTSPASSGSEPACRSTVT